jgi:hypothetical protein
MAQSGFPVLEQHRTAHQTLMAQALQQAHRLQYGERPDLSLLMSFLREAFLSTLKAPIGGTVHGSIVAVSADEPLTHSLF